MLAAKFKPKRSQFAFVTRCILLALMACIAIALLLAPKPWEHPHLGKSEDYIRVYSWWAGLINLVPLACLALTTGWWMRPLPAQATGKSSPRLPKGFSVCVGGATAACAILGYPRLGQSLWEDEEYSVRRCIVGGHRVLEDGTVVVKKLPWKVTLWNYALGTNHIFQSILSRVSHSAWRTIARPTGLQLSEAAARLPSYVSGILLVGVVALLAARFGLAWEGALASWLIAIHPWHLRFTTEARGYGLVALLIPVSCLLAVHALNRGQWRWWIALAMANFALPYTWPPTLFTVLILNVCIAVSLFTEERFSSTRTVFTLRWLVSGTFAGIVFLQLFLPCVPGLFGYLKRVRDFDGHAFFLKNVAYPIPYGKPLVKERPAGYAVHGISSPCERPSGGLSHCHRCCCGPIRVGNFPLVGRRTQSALARGGPHLPGNPDLCLCSAPAQDAHGMVRWLHAAGGGAHGCGRRILGVLAAAEISCRAVGRDLARNCAGLRLRRALASRPAFLAHVGRRTLPGIRARDAPKSGSQRARKPKNHHRCDHTATLRLRSQSAPGSKH